MGLEALRVGGVVARSWHQTGSHVSLAQERERGGGGGWWVGLRTKLGWVLVCSFFAGGFTFGVER